MIDRLKISKLRLFTRDKESDHLISVKSLSVNYGKLSVLEKVSFNIDKRDVFGIIGLSGSGKTTILKALMNLLSFKGMINIGEDVKRIGYCPQENAFFDELTINENALIMSSLVRTDYNTLQKRLKSYMKDLYLDESPDKTAGELSGGQKKRLNIILSLLHDPELVIMDEPFAGLDYLNRSLLWRFILRLRRKGKTVILTTHLLDEAQKHCNKVLIISKGRRFAMGSISDLKRRFNFNHFMRVRFNYLNKSNEAKINEFCKTKDAMMLEVLDNYASFSIPDEQVKLGLELLFKRLRLKYSIVEFRPPTLNDLFMVTSK